MSRMYVGRFIYQINQQAAALKGRRHSLYGCMDNAFSTTGRQDVRTSVLLREAEKPERISSIFEESCRMMRKYLLCLTIYVCQEDRKREVSSLTYTTSHCKKALSEPRDICAILELWSLFLHRSLPNCWSKENSCHLRLTHTR